MKELTVSQNTMQACMDYNRRFCDIVYKIRELEKRILSYKIDYKTSKVIPDMVEGLLRQKNTIQGVVFQWDTELRAVLQWNKELRAVLQGNKELGVAEGRMCGMGRRRIVQLVEPHEHFEEGLD